jgi:hypothetical protein
MTAVFSYSVTNYDTSEAIVSLQCTEYTTSESNGVHYCKLYSQSTVQISKWKGKPRQGKTIIVKGLHLGPKCESVTKPSAAKPGR